MMSASLLSLGTAFLLGMDCTAVLWERLAATLVHGTRQDGGRRGRSGAAVPAAAGQRVGAAGVGGRRVPAGHRPRPCARRQSGGLPPATSRTSEAAVARAADGGGEHA